MRAPTRDIEAAGAVVFRRRKGECREVLLVHRPKYDDWSFPKGKLDRGEHVTAAAVREVEEETGLPIRLARPLRPQRYRVGRGWKRVSYWTGRVREGGDDDVSGYQRPGEIDRAAWVPIADASRMLTYPHDRATLREAIAARKTTYPLIVLRHGEARARDTWRGADPERPLLAAGKRQAARLPGVLAAYGVTRIVTSTSERCRQTVEPYAAVADVRLESTTLLSEEGAAEVPTGALILGLARDLAARGPLVVCSHRPVLPMIFAALGMRKLALEKGEMAVLHLRKGKVVAIERHLPL
ncbi:NUDIX hydrolase [Nocardioides sp. BP30]|uniref:NUDIX hydrolase n=1 Tax=Nocardioides sp. BP30 TaxID=3036374 RepID=UPI0024685A17|nr:NUDIX hydrolase [Nocardioides sp. BP30]WGL52084.1 NUDIX hydrolase [Nocardioides sp. BP30]